MISSKKKCYLALLLAVVTVICAVAPGNGLVTHAANDEQTESNQEEIKVLDRKERTDLDADEIAKAEELVIAMDYGFDVETDFEGISYNQGKVTVSYDKGNSNFNGQKVGTYDTFYKVEPASGKTAYLIHRMITVKEVTEQKSTSANANQKDSATDSEEDGEADEEADPDKVVDLDEKKVSSLSIKLSSNAVMQATAATAGTKLNVAYSEYAKYCGHSMGIKYISTEGSYKNRLVYCMNMSKNTTNGNVEIAGNSKVKPQVTYCLVNGVRKLNGTCNNSKYSAGSAKADYFITNAAIHVINGEVKLSYYNV